MKKKMKIAFVYQPLGPISIPLRSGSLGIWIYHVARRLTKSASILVYARKGAGQARVVRHDQVEYRRISAGVDVMIARLLNLFSHWRKPQKPLLALSLYYLGYIIKVAFDVKRQQVDVVHVFNFSQFVPILKFIAPKSRVILHMECEWLSQLDKAMIEKRIDDADLVIGCSHYITRKITARYPAHSSKCLTIYNGVEIDSNGKLAAAAKVDDKLQKLIFVGRVSPEKGVHVLIDAFAIVAREFPNCTLDIIGPEWVAPLEYIVGLSDDAKVADLASFYKKSYLAQLEERVPASIKDRITFVGHVSPQDLPGFYQQADVLINPSFSEAFGMTLVEALSNRVPVIASRVGGMVEVVEGQKVGLLVESGVAADLADAIAQLLRDANLRASMGKAGRERVKQLFSWDHVAAEFHQQCENVYAQHR